MKQTIRLVIAGIVVLNSFWTQAFASDEIKKIVAAVVSRSKINSDKSPEQLTEIITEYMTSLKLSPSSKVFKDTLDRLFNSNMQFLVCEDYEDWECLEATPVIEPKTIWRQEIREGLGSPVRVNDSLRMESYFTQAWAYRERKEKVPSTLKSVADTLAEKIRKERINALYMALFGIDDIEDSMKNVFDSIEERSKDKKVAVKAVLDVLDGSRSNGLLRDYDVIKQGKNLIIKELGSLNFSYVKPEKDPNLWVWAHPEWMDQISSWLAEGLTWVAGSPKSFVNDAIWLSKSKSASSAIRLAFQYKETAALARLLNHGVKKNEDAVARIEFPMDSIMHNKFFVFKDKNKMKLWSGTANVARTCMGNEDNSNMAIFIDNTAIASSFLEEFNEMYQLDPKNDLKKAPGLVTGRFHRNKRPNTLRYYQLSDGHDVRVHFSPTDDAEHRVLLPMIYSANEGDILRISMFGAGGIEMVRALQKAAARGVDIRIVLDKFTGSNAAGWLYSAGGNLLEENPYSKSADPIQVKVSEWDGMNHHKTATLSRKEGKKYRTEMLIVGSQNWSITGNDSNDENMVTIRHLEKSLPEGDAFNQEFDKNLMPLAGPPVIKKVRSASESGDDEREDQEAP